MGQIVRTSFSCHRDELRIQGTVFHPENGGNLPVAIVSHGFKATRKSVFEYAEALANCGYAAFTFDFCGGSMWSASQGDTRDMSVLTEVEDLKAVMEFASGQSFTRSDPPLLVGASQGGLVSALTANELKDGVGGLILLYPALSIPSDAREGNMAGMKFDPQNLPKHLYSGFMPIGQRYVTDVQHMDVYSSIKHYPGKVLIIHGSADKVVPVTFARFASRSYKSAGADVELLVIQDGDHGLTKNPQRQEAMDKLTSFATELLQEE